MKLIDKDYLIQYLTGMANAECCDDNTERIIKKYIIPHIDTLEVKNVDLDKEIEKELETRWRGEYLFTSKFRESAKHFYELGLQAQK